MSVNSLLLLQASDIKYCALRKARFQSVKKIIIDAGILEQAVLADLDIDYVNLDVGKNFIARVSTEATTRATRLDQELTRLREKIFGVGLFQGWDHGLAMLFFIRALVAKGLGEFSDQHFKDPVIGLLRPGNPQNFYFDSFVSTDAFVGDSRRWRIVEDYDVEGHPIGQNVHACFDFSWIKSSADNGDAGAIVHIPTVFHDFSHFSSEIQSKFSRFIELPSLFWDVKIGKNRCPLIGLKNIDYSMVTKASIVYRERSRQIIKDHIRDVIGTPWILDRQCDFWADIFQLQAITYEGLHSSLKGRKPHFVLTDHDVGYNGPLFSVAAECDSPITLLPHSNTPSLPLPHSKNVIAIERDGFASPVRSIYGQRVSTRPIRLNPIPEPRPRREIRVLCLLINALVHYGISHIDLHGLMTFHRSLQAICEKYGVDLKVRLKPNAPGILLASATFGIDPAELSAVMRPPLADISRDTDVCVAFGEMTAGVIDFFESGSLVVHASSEIRPTDICSTTALSVMPSLPALDLKAASELVEHLLQSPESFTAMVAQQQREFASRLSAKGGAVFDDVPAQHNR